MLVKVTPLGSAPASVKDATGKPVVVTVKEPAVPTANVALLALVMAGAWSTFNVKLCEVLPELLLVLMVIAYFPPVPAAGVPAKVAVPLWLSANVTPAGNGLVSVKVGVGVPVVVTENVPAVPTVNVVLLALVIANAASTVSVKVWTAAAPTPFAAVKLIEYVPPLPEAGVPLRVAVPLPLSLKVTPLGSAPVSATDGVGKPVVSTVNDAEAPTLNVVPLGLAMAGA